MISILESPENNNSINAQENSENLEENKLIEEITANDGSSTEQPPTECTALTVKPSNQLIVATQIMTKTIRISIKSIIISISLTILNLFI